MMNPSERSINFLKVKKKKKSVNALTADTVHSRSSIKTPWASLAVKSKGNTHWSGGLCLVKAVVIYFGIYPWILTSFVRSWHHIQPWQTQFAVLISPQPCFLPCFLSWALPECGRREVSRPGRFDVFLRKRSAFHKHPVFSTQTDQAEHRSVAL